MHPSDYETVFFLRPPPKITKLQHMTG